MRAGELLLEKWGAVVVMLIEQGPARASELEQRLGLGGSQVPAVLTNPAVAAALKEMGPAPRRAAEDGDGNYGGSAGGAAKRHKGPGGPKHYNNMVPASGNWQSPSIPSFAAPPPHPVPMGQHNWGPAPQAPAWQQPAGAGFGGNGIGFSGGGGAGKGKCRHCGQPGHWARECPNGGAAQYGPRPPM